MKTFVNREDLRPGLYFAKKIEDKEQLWTIVLLLGEFPFLHGICLVFENDIRCQNNDGIDMERALRRGYEIGNPNHWIFHSRIDFPSEDTVDGSDVLLGVKFRKLSED